MNERYIVYAPMLPGRPAGSPARLSFSHRGDPVTVWQSNDRAEWRKAEEQRDGSWVFEDKYVAIGPAE